MLYGINQDEVAFEAGEPLTDEEFNSNEQGKAGNNFTMPVLRNQFKTNK